MVSMNDHGLGIFYNINGAKFVSPEYQICENLNLPLNNIKINTEREYSFNFSNSIF